MKIKGVKRTCSDSKNLNQRGEWLELFFHVYDREVWAVYHYSINDEWTEYRDSSIVRVGTTTQAMSQKEIVAMLKRNILDRLYPEM